VVLPPPPRRSAGGTTGDDADMWGHRLTPRAPRLPAPTLPRRHPRLRCRPLTHRAPDPPIPHLPPLLLLPCCRRTYCRRGSGITRHSSQVGRSIRALELALTRSADSDPPLFGATSALAVTPLYEDKATRTAVGLWVCASGKSRERRWHLGDGFSILMN
jgi:hypothetical protein